MKRTSLHPRDQDDTPFASILWDLCAAVGAKKAALVDSEGETVDYGGDGEPFDIRILAAEWRLILQRLQEGEVLGSTKELVVRARRKSYSISALPEGYALVIELGRRSCGASYRALRHAVKRVCKEAGFDPGVSNSGEWTGVAVQEERGSRRPLSLLVSQVDQEVTVIGRVSFPDGSTGPSFRVRLSSGDELTLVREAFGYWYIQEDEFSTP